MFKYINNTLYIIIIHTVCLFLTTQKRKQKYKESMKFPHDTSVTNNSYQLFVTPTTQQPTTILLF